MVPVLGDFLQGQGRGCPCVTGPQGQLPFILSGSFKPASCSPSFLLTLDVLLLSMTPLPGRLTTYPGLSLRLFCPFGSAQDPSRTLPGAMGQWGRGGLWQVHGFLGKCPVSIYQEGLGGKPVVFLCLIHSS